MPKRLLPLLLILLIPIGGYLWYRETPEQQIYRTVDRFLENVEHRKISTRRKADVHEALREVLAAKVSVQGDDPIPNEEMTLDEVIAKVDFIHNFSNLIEITEVERDLKIVGNKAQVYLTADVLGISGIGRSQWKNEETWDLIIDLEKDEDWRITGVRGTKP